MGRLSKLKLGVRCFSGKAWWFRSTSAPIAKPAQFRYKPKEKPGGFEPFSPEDSRRLEEAFKSGHDQCTIQKDGLYKVKFKERHYVPTYWEGPTYQVLRGTWFIDGAKPTPLAENVAAEIEQHYENNEMEFRLESGHAVKLTKKDDGKVSGTLVSPDKWTDMLKSLQLTGSQAIVRGYQKAEVAKNGTKAQAKSSAIQKSKRVSGTNKMEDNVPPPSSSGETEREIKHLVLAIHGIGQQLGIRYEFVNFVKDADEMRTLMDQVFAKDEELQLAARSKTSHGIQVLPILWRHLLPKQAKNLDPRLEGLTAPQLMAKDNILADVALDYVMYTHDEYRESMIQVTASELNRVFREFCENNPEFAKNPKVSIAGHSLGSVIANDLLRSDTVHLDFKVENTFFLGSPVGCLQYLTGRAFTKENFKAKNLYNIFRPSDPIGSRIEPLVNKKAIEVCPEELPANDKILAQIKDITEELTKLGLSITNGASVLWNQIADTTKNVEQQEYKPQQHVSDEIATALRKDLACFNRHGRLDFSIPESVDISLFLAIAGHTMYFDNYDLAMFIMREILGVRNELKPMIQATSTEIELESS